MMNIELPYEPGDVIRIVDQNITAVIIKIEITKIGIKIIAINKLDRYEFWDIQFGKDFLVVLNTRKELDT